MTQNLTPAQQTQLENRDASGQFKAKEHGDVDDDTDVLGIGSAEDRFNRTMVMDDLESRRGDRAQQAQLSLIVREDEARAQSKRSVRDMIDAQGLLDDLRDHSVASVELTPYSDGGGGYYVSAAEDNDGNDISGSEELDSLVYGRNIDVQSVAEQADLPTDIAGSVTFKPAEGLGEEFTRERLEAQRGEIIAQDRPKDPRDAIRDALPDDPEIAEDVIARLDENRQA